MKDAPGTFERSLQLLSSGRYQEGWPLYEARAKPQLPFPEWCGEDLSGKSLAVWLDQGLGDKIMFSRFVPRLCELAADVTLVCEPALARLFASNFPARVVSASGRVEFPDPDYWTTYGSLPLRLSVTLGDLSGAAYLRPDRVEHLPRGRIGVVTRGNPANPLDANRSLPDALAMELLRLPGAVSLHYADLGVRDFLDSAAIVAGLDLVITVDTAMAHLAGALGVPVWVMLPAAACDWRWLEGRSDSPWYASARLFRQPEPGNWHAVIAGIVGSLEERERSAGRKRVNGESANRRDRPARSSRRAAVADNDDAGATAAAVPPAATANGE